MKKIKQPKSKFQYNPQYKRGYEMLQGVRANNALTSSAIREPYNYGDFNVVSTEDAPALTYDEQFRQYPELDENANPIDLKDGEVVERNEDGSIDNTPWYWKPIKNWYDDTKEDISVIANTNPLDIWRQGVYKQVSSHLSSVESRMTENNWNIEQNDEAKLYLSQIEKIQKLQYDIDRAKQYNNPTVLQNYQKQFNDEVNKLTQLDKDIRAKWRDSDTFLKSFTDFDKWNKLSNILDNAATMMSPTRYNNNETGIWNNIKYFASSLLSSATNMFSNAAYSIGDLVQGTEDGNARVRNAVRNSRQDNQYINSMFKSALDVIGDKQKLDEYATNLRLNIENLGNKYKRLGAELDADHLSTLNTLKNGNAFFDPRKIDPIYKSKQEKNDLSIFSILNPLKWGYMLPELGSSYSDLQTTLEMLGTDAAFAYAGQLLNPGKKAKIALGLLSTGTGLAIANAQKKEETGSEVTDAYAQRLVNELYSNHNIDTEKVLQSMDRFSKSIGGLEFDPNELNIQEKMQLAMSYNIKTGDPVFDDLAIKYRKGLQKVYNENMTLSTMDFLEALPFMSYTRSVMSDIASKPFNALAGKIGKTKAGKYLLDAKSTVADKYNTVTRAITDKAITKMFGEGVENAAKKLKTLHAAQWMTDKFKKGMYSGFFEGIEEGQQQLLQNRYMRGDYDDYDYPRFDGTIANPFTLFDFPSAFKDLDLATSAVFSYMGLNYGDPDNGSDELRNAMTTGALTGMIFSALYPMTINNIYRADMDPTNLRALYRQFKNDAVLGKLVAENYNKEQDDAHIAAFYNAMDKRGFNTTQLIKSLNDFKRFKGDLVDDEYIDKDVKLLTATNNLYHNPYLNDLVKDPGVSEDDKLKVIQNGVRAIMDYDRISNKAKSQSVSIDTRSQALFDIVDDMLSDKEQADVPEEVKQQRELLKPLVDLIAQSYEESAKEGNQNKDTKKQSILSNEDFKKEAKKKFEYDKKLSEAKSDEEKAKVNQEFDSFLDTEADKKADTLTSKASFVKVGLSNLLKIQQLVQMDKMIKMFAQKHDFAEHVEREFGIDLHNDRLGSILTQMHNIYKEILGQYSKTFSESMGNAATDGTVKPISLDQITESVKEFLPYLDQFSDLNNLFKSNVVNEALRRVYSPYVSAYTQGKADPTMVTRSMRRLPWKLLSQQDKDEFIKNHINANDNLSESQIKQKYLDFVKKEEKAFLDLKARGKKAHDTYYGKDEMDRTVSDAEEYNKQTSEIQKEAAKELIRLDLALKRSRQRIAHERFLNEGAALSENETQESKNEQQSSTDTNTDTEASQSTESQEQQPQGEQQQEQDGNQMPKEGIDILTQAQTDDEANIEGDESNIEDDGIADDMLTQQETSTEDLVDEAVSRGPKRKKKEQPAEKPVTKEDIADGSEDKPGVAATVNNNNTDALGATIDAISDKETEHNNQDKEKQDDDIDKNEEKEDPAKVLVNNILNGHYTVSDITSMEPGIYDTTVLYAGKEIPVRLYVHSDGEYISVSIHTATDNPEESNRLFIQNIMDNADEHTPDGYIVPDGVLAFNEITVGKDGVAVAFIDNKGNMQMPASLVKKGVHVDPNVDMSNPNNSKDTADNDPNTSGQDLSDTESDDITIQDGEEDNNDIELSINTAVPSVNANNTQNQQTTETSPAQNPEKEDTNTESGQNYEEEQQDNTPKENHNGILEILDDDTIMIGDEVLTDEQAQGILEDNDFQNDIEEGILDICEDGVEYTQSGTTVDYDVESKSKVYRDFLSQTFFYNPVATTPPRLNRGEEDVTNQLPYKLGTAKELSEKLLIPGWFNKAKKYYVVTADKNAFNTLDEDQYSVAMIIQDDENKKCYASFMRAAGDTDIYGNSRVEGLWNKLWKIGIDSDVQKYNGIFRLKLAGIYSAVHKGNVGTEKEVDNWFNSIDAKLKRNIIDEARRAVALPNGRPLKVEEIERSIQQLKQRRHEIIDAYCEKTTDGKYLIPEKIRTDVLPNQPRISNGSIQSIPRREGQAPKWHILFGSEQRLGIPEDIGEINQAINDGQVQFGYGSGMFGNDPFSILSVNGPAQTFPGKGLAGKLYFIYTAANGKKVPIMLREQRFNTISVDGKQKKMAQDNVELRIDPQTGKIIEGKWPSAAEVLFYMLIGKLDTSYLPVKDAALMKQFVDLFVNNGESTINTIGKSQYTLNKLSYYAKKKLQYDSENGRLIMALPNDDGILTQVVIPINQLLDTTEDAAALRRKIVLAIAENMHFNTDKEQLVSKIPSEILSALKSYFERNKTNSFSICGIPQFSFNREDLFDDNFIERDITTLAWMVKTGRLVSDISSTPLYAPFVYATGVKKSSTQKQTDVIEQQAADTPKDTKPAKKSQKQTKKQDKDTKENKPKKHALTSIIDATINKFISKYSKVDTLKRKNVVLEDVIENINNLSDDERNALKEYLNSKHVVGDQANCVDVLIANVSGISGEESVKKAIKEKIDSYVKETGYETLCKQKSGEKYKGVKIKWPELNLGKKDIPLVKFREDGTVDVYYMDVSRVSPSIVAQSNDLKSGSNPVSGLFSEERGEGVVDVKKAKQWLQDTLGLKDEQILAFGRLFVNGEEKFGMVHRAYGQVYDAIIGLSEQAGEGIEYHEAWHYINVLLHDAKTREAIYREYASQHNLSKDTSFKAIEELLAEEFRAYALTENSNRLKYKIKKYFNRMLNFLHIYKSKENLIRQIFNDINSGRYKNIRPNKDSLLYFKEEYNDTIFSDFFVPGINEKKIDKLKAIDTYQQFYQTAESISNMMIDKLAITKVSDFNKVTDDFFQKFMKDLYSSRTRDNEDVFTDIYNNKEVFYSILKETFKQYGIEVKIKKLKQLKKAERTLKNDAIIAINEAATEKEDENKEKADIGDAPDNVWDRFSFSTSKKDNVAFRAKLFMSHIPRAKLYLPENSSEKQIEYVTDPLLGCNTYIPFSEAWTKVLSELWDIESYGIPDKNGNYPSTSLRGKIKQRAKNEWFYRVLDEKLDDLDYDGDTELQSQIYVTIKSQNAQMAQIWLQDPQNKFTVTQFDEDTIGAEEFTSVNAQDDTIDDVQREWKIVNDNALRAKRSLPREWSNSAVLSGLIAVNNGNTVVSPEFVKHADELFKNIKDSCKDDKKQLKGNIYTQEKYESVYNGLIDLLNFLCIPCDADVLELLIDEYVDHNLYDMQSRWDALRNIVNVSKEGTISSIITMLKKSSGLQNLIIGKSKTKDPYKIFMQYKDDSQIIKIAELYNRVHPASQDFSVKGPDGSMHYPINQNNHMSDAIRQLNTDPDAIAMKMRSPYAKHSLLFTTALNNKNTLFGENAFKLNAFIGLKDTRKQEGKDYFGISYMEDYLCKMTLTFNNMLILPTMADKKTWYAIQQKLIKLPHDLVLYNTGSFTRLQTADVDETVWNPKTQQQEKTGKKVQALVNVPYENFPIQAMRFSDTTLDMFVGYFMDEIETLKQYYNRDNIAYLKKHKNLLRSNYHGKFVKNDNGEERMTFTGNGGLFRYMYDIYKNNGLNLNQLLEARYEKQKHIEQNAKDENGINELRKYNTDSGELDGFELVRYTLGEIEKHFSKDGYTDTIHNAINEWLMSRVTDEIDAVTKPSVYRIGHRDQATGHFVADAIPSEIMNEYVKLLKERVPDLNIDSTNIYSNQQLLDSISLSAIANHSVSEMISIIELEKAFAGDPAFYKWKYQKAAQEVTVDGTSVKIRILKEKDTDKIKRLGALLSPGDNIRTDYDEQTREELNIAGDKYTTLTLKDFELKSNFIDTIVPYFQRQAAVNTLRAMTQNGKKIDFLDAYIAKYHIKDYDSFFDKMISGTDKMPAQQVYEKFMDSKNHDKKYKETIEKFKDAVEKSANAQCSPYGIDNDSLINVSDAQVIIRPEMYRRIRIGIGRWSEEDEEAYKLIEEDGNWMHDPEKAKIVSKLQLFPLKMSYFQNDPVIWSAFNKNKPQYYNLPIYNKMAIFPMFKYMTQSTTGKTLYERMNRKWSEIDMLIFESAVKVGASQNKSESLPEKLKKFSGGISSVHLDENNNVVKTRDTENSLPIEVQSLNGLRMQLNTDAHLAEERSIGTQMSKIAFSNVIDGHYYGNRKGKAVRHDIMNCINALTEIGAKSVADEFEIKNGIADEKKIHDYVRRVVMSNGLGTPSQQIIENGGVAASLTSRRVFENGVSSLVNGEVVDIETKGGSAIQQSIFGLTGFNKDNVATWEENGYRNLNGGKEIKWLSKKNTMEVMLSINFFRAILPNDLQNATFAERRQWLVDHDIIYGKKTSASETEPTESNPEAIGIGYRIPTQGQSSMFGFICADVLPETSGDLIIVPREFTAQTGSDFDVDKLFIAMKSYTNGVYDDFTDEEYEKIKELYINKPKDKNAKKSANPQNDVTKYLADSGKKGALQNRLIQNYLDILLDDSTFADARGSIDTITGKIKKELLPLLQTSETEYRKAGYELLPSFQLRRKMEFTTGKSGIGAFALNVTNIALTQFTNLTLHYTPAVEPFNFGDLNESIGQDGLPIAGWLSAMVNAHVDVAKDPYIFDMNINSATYDYVNFLLRAGKGLSTFTFIAQPAIKQLADLLQNTHNMYGDNIKSRKTTGKYKSPMETVRENYMKDLGEIDLNEIKNEDLRLLITAAKANKLKGTKKETGISWNKEFAKVFNIDYAKKMLKKPTTLDEYAEQLCFQMICLSAWDKIEPLASEMSSLVKMSRIDTKKFGNNIAEHINFLNSYDNFIYGNRRVTWYIKNGEKRKTHKEIEDAEKTYGKNYALERYFNSTFLDSKLKNATKLTRTILRNQLCTATENFEDIFKSFAFAINGGNTLHREYLDKDKKIQTTNVYVYNPIVNAEVVSSISQAIDNIMRYYILRAAPAKQTQEERASGGIDFTCKNNPKEVRRQFSRLMFGDPEGSTEYMKNSVFKNLALLIDDLQRPKDKEMNKRVQSSGLVDDEGRITNDLLNFLRPQTASAKYPIGRMLLAKSSFGITGQEESRLISAFDQLLKSPNNRIRMIARDLVFYAYYSQYDVNSASSFFKLVPYRYRAQYDKALSYALKQNTSRLYEILSRAEKQGLSPEETEARTVDEVIDNMCRNYWYDDNIVPIFRTYPSYKEQTLNGNASTIQLFPQTHQYKKEFVNNLVQHNVFGIILSKFSGGSPYIKVQTGKDWYLYKNIGTVTRRDNTGEKESTGAYNVYAVIQKRGIHEDGKHQFEYATERDDVSIFKSNLLPDTLSLTENKNSKGLLNKLAQYIANQAATAPVDDKKQPLVTYEVSDIQPNVIKQFNGYTDTGTTNKSITKTNDGAITFRYEKPFASKSLKEGETFFQHYVSLQKKTGALTLDISSSQDIDKQISELISKYKTDPESGVIRTYNLIVYGDIKTVGIDNTAVNNYINQLRDDYENTLLANDPNINKELLKTQVDDYIKTIDRQQVIDALSQGRINARLKQYLDKLTAGGVQISTYISDGLQGVGEATLRYVQQKHAENSFITGRMVIENKKGKVDDDSAIALATKYNDPNGLLFLSNDEYTQLKTFAKVVSDATETTDQILDGAADDYQQGLPEAVEGGILLNNDAQDGNSLAAALGLSIATETQAENNTDQNQPAKESTSTQNGKVQVDGEFSAADTASALSMFSGNSALDANSKYNENCR